MRAKKAICILLSVCMLFTLAGCGYDSANKLVSPPELSGEMYPISMALRESAGNNYDLKYPTSGERRSAIVLEDINSDGVFEAFAFYSTNEDEMTHMHINVICQKDGKWVSVNDQTIVAIGVETVDFCDLNNDGVMEILVGWVVNGTSEKQLSVFTFENGALVQKLLQPYTNFMCCDLDSNGTSEVFVQALNASEKSNRAIVYGFSNGEMAQMAGCIMDRNVKTAAAPKLSTLSTGQSAIYIDEIKGVGAVTEVLFFSKGELVNPLLDTENSYENNLTLRAAALQIKDINSDGIIEIPVSAELPSVLSDESVHYTNWCSFNGERLSVKLITLVNTVDGYYLVLPNSLVGNIAVLKDIEGRKRVIHAYNSANGAVEDVIFSVTAVDIKKWHSDGFDRGDMIEIAKNDTTVFAAEADNAEKYGVSIDDVKNMFNLID